MSTSATPHGVYLPGSVQLPDTETVFKTVSQVMPGRVRRIPDGETGARRYYLTWMLAVLKDLKGLTLTPAPAGNMAALPALALEPGVSARDVRFGNLGIADAAIESYKVFERLQKEGSVAADARFLVTVMSPMEVVAIFLGFDYEGFEPGMEAAMKAEVERIVAAIPHDRLAIQIDIVSALYIYGSIGSFPSPFKGKDPKKEVLDRIVRYSSWVPADVQLGYHFCFGDAAMDAEVMEQGRTELGLERPDTAGSPPPQPTESGAASYDDYQPQTAAVMVELANTLNEVMPRPYDFVHMPFPMHRATKEFVEPLRDLKLAKGAELYLGLVNWRDGIEGAKKRIALATGVAPPFGISTACGMGRIGGGTERQIELFKALSELSEPL